MIYEINQIKKFLAEKHSLPLEGEGLDLRVAGKVPDGDHEIPLGSPAKKYHVFIRDDSISIGDPVPE